ncbi:hypothetical protein B1H20_20655 [Streptomyces violaceoruber]|uniref:Uncharacterized protein n=1 Tax=Streptomyces violaceoruber TaxID=1935 RepID=A0A1V0UE50_STRVN|nr:hypothetical protein B1H20_20655 [Streptomyces violaceoruber]
MVHTVRRTLRGIEQECAETARNTLRAGPAHLPREPSPGTGAAAQAAPGSPGSRTTRIPRRVPEPGPDSTR